MDMIQKQEENFATSLNPNARFGEQVPSMARFNVERALANGIAPEQAAADVRLARQVGTTPEYLMGLKPEDKASEQVNAFDWAAMQKESPVLMQMLEDPAFAAEVKDDPRQAGFWERAWWYVSPKPDERGGWWQTARNAVARGGYGLVNSAPIFGNESVLEDARQELQGMKEMEDALQNGKTVAEVFGSEEDPSGEGAYARFLSSKDVKTAELKKKMYAAAQSMAWANRVAKLFPNSYGFEELASARTAGEALGAFARNPITIALDAGLESLVRQTPQLVGLAVGAALGGAPAATLGAGATSYTLERGARLAEAMSNYNLDASKPEDVLRWYASPDYRAQFAMQGAKAKDAASVVAALDAISGGVAATRLVPKGFLGMSNRMSNVSEAGVQALVQGGLGSAGEAGAQIATEGRITGWADVVAEFAGEFVTSPFDVAAAAIGRQATAQSQIAMAQQFAQQTEKLTAYAKVSQLLANDPETTAEYVKNIAKQNGTPNLYVDVQSMHQSGYDELFTGASPELAERYQQSLAKGEEMKVTAEEVLTVLAPRDQNNALTETLHPEDGVSLAEARQMEQSAAEETSTRLAQSLEGATGDFAASSAEVGKTVEGMLDEAFGDNTNVKDGGMSKPMRQMISAYLQTLFTTTAKDLGVTPMEVFRTYGPQLVMSPADAVRMADGKLQVTSDRAKQLFTQTLRGDQQSFSQHGTAKENVHRGLKAIKALLSKKQSVTDAMTYNGSPVDFDYGYEGDARIDARGRRKGEHGFLHLLEARWRKDGLSEEEIRILLDDLVYTIAYGKADANTAKDRAVLRLRIHGGECLTVLKRPKDRNVWVLTGYYLNPSTGATTQGLVKSGATQPKPTTTRPGLGAVATDSLTILEQSVLTSKALRQIGLERKLFSPIQPRHLPQGTIGDWFPSVRAIAQWAGANRSTFLHETGHMFLDMRVRIARDLAAKRASGAELTQGEKHLLETAESTMKWLGTDLESFANMTTDQQRPMHEKFARTYEAYIMEGHAPSSALTKLFRSFSNWLVGVYRAVANIPEAEINPEVRELFDSLLVASTEVEAARQRRAQFERYNDPMLEALADEMGENFADLQKESSDAAIEEMRNRLQRASAQVAKLRQGKIDELTEEAQRIYNGIVDRIWQEVMASPEYQAYVALTEGINGLMPKLTRKDIENVKPHLTSAQIAILEKADMVGTNPKGVNAAMVAEKFGFDSVDAMIYALIHLGDPTQHVFDLAATEMLEQHADISSPEAIEKSADAAIFNDARLRILNIEAMALNRALGNKTDVFKKLKAGAETAVSRIRLKDLGKESSVHAANAARNARESETARKHGDIQGAAAAKIRELYQAAIVRFITLKRKDVERALKFFKRFSGVKTLAMCDADYLMAIQHVLDCIGYAKFPDAGAQQRRSLADFLSTINQAELDEDSGLKGIDADMELVTKIDRGELTLDNMTAAQFETVNGIIREIYALGRQAASIEVEGQRIALEEARSDLVEGLEEHAGQKGKKPLDNYEKTGRLSVIRQTLSKIGLSHARIPSLFNCMEGVLPGYGRFFKYLTRKFDACGNRESAMKNEITKALHNILSPMFKGLSSTGAVYYESVGASFTKQQVFVMALNMGNSGNIQRLIDNSSGWSFMHGNRLTQEQVLDVISKTLTADEIKRVQAIWDLFAALQKEVAEKEIRMRGRAPAWVEAEPIALASSDGAVVQLRGGYYPIVYDREASAMGARIDASKGVLQEIKAVKGQASTWKGHLKDRAKKVEAGTPLTLTLRGAFEGFENTIHDVCWDEWVTEARRLFGRNSVLDGTIRKYYGADTMQAIRDWIKDTAAGKNTQSSMGDGIATFMRKNISLVGIGFNLVTAAIQTVGITQTVVALGGKWTLSGVGEMLTRGPMGAYKFAASKSLLIQDRIRTQFREVAEIQRYTSSGTNKLYDGLSRMAYMPVAMVQMMVDLPTWMGAYNRALAEGKSDAEAVAMADRMLIEAQGSGRFQDLSAIERGNAWEQLFTVFYTFFNTTYNLAKMVTQTRDKLAMARDLTLLLIAQPVIETFVREALKVQPDDEDDDKYWERMQKAAMQNTLNFNMSMLVGLREIASVADLVADKPPSYNGPTGTKKFTDILRWAHLAYKEWGNEDEIDPNFIRQSITVFSEITGAPVPVVPINRYLRGKQAIEEGDTTDWKAYLFGYTKR